MKGPKQNVPEVSFQKLAPMHVTFLRRAFPATTQSLGLDTDYIFHQSDTISHLVKYTVS